jgi:hypothetical protein
MEEAMTDNEELRAEIASLKAELAELKQSMKPPEVFVPTPMPRFDPTEGMSMSPAAMKPMASLIDPKGAKFDPNHWGRGYPQPGGFGSPARPGGGGPEVKRGTGWSEPRPLKGVEPGSPGTEIFDAMVDRLVGGPNDTRKLR